MVAHIEARAGKAIVSSGWGSFDFAVMRVLALISFAVVNVLAVCCCDRTGPSTAEYRQLSIATSAGVDDSHTR